jgi:mannose-6-phosphate isomerase-like protein (cupin superfamily)
MPIKICSHNRHYGDPAMPSTIPSKIRHLTVATQAALARRNAHSALDPVGREIQRILALLDPPPVFSGTFEKSNHPITAFIADAIKGSDDTATPLLDAAAPALPYLPWRYTPEPYIDLGDFNPRVASAELIGPDAPFRSAALRLGLTLVAPDTYAPAHHHIATELYCVISGNAAWVVDGVPRISPPGTFILHPSQSVHALRTGPSPLLALYTRSAPDTAALADYSI